MDAKRTADPNVLVLEISLPEAKDLNHIIDHFRDWDDIASADDPTPMLFLLKFGTDCGFAARGWATLEHPVETGRVPLSRDQVGAIARLLEVAVQVDGQQMSWVRRNLLKLMFKTLRNRLAY